MVLHKVGEPFELEEVPKPQIGPRDALVKVRACGSGLTIHHTVAGRTPAKLPLIIGHEIAGEVVELGSEVDDLAIGDRVTVYYYLFCGRCRFCLSRREPLCELQPGNVGRAINGGYAEYVRLPAENVLKLPPGLPYDERPADVAIITDAIATPLKVCRRTRVQPTETMVVFGGAGGVGIHLVQMASRVFNARVIAVDLGPQKLTAAVEAGAHETIDAASEDPLEGIRRLTNGKGADVIADFVGATQTVSAGVQGLGTGGRLTILAGAGGGELTIKAGQTLRGEQEILGSRYVTRQEVHESLELVARGLIKPIVNHIFPLEQANQAHELVGRSAGIGRVALVID